MQDFCLLPSPLCLLYFALFFITVELVPRDRSREVVFHDTERKLNSDLSDVVSRASLTIYITYCLYWHILILEGFGLTLLTFLRGLV